MSNICLMTRLFFGSEIEMYKFNIFNIFFLFSYKIPGISYRNINTFCNKLGNK